MAVKKKEKNFSSFLNNPFDFTLLIITILLLAIGLIMVLSASSPSALAETESSYTYFIRQLQFAIIGIVLMLVLSKIDYRFYKKYYWMIYGVSLVLLILVLVTGEEINGATRWIEITSSYSFQPSEIVKIGMIIFYAAMINKNRNDMKQFGRGFVKHITFIAPIIVLLLLQPHLSASIVILGVVLIIMLVGGTKIKHFIGTGLFVGIPGLILAVVLEPYRLQRFITFMDPWQNPTGDGWQIIQSLYAIGSGGLFGVGLGESKQKFLYIPEPQNDFIFSIIGEELGFIGCVIVIALFAIFIWRGILIAMKAPDMFGSLVAIGITALVAIQVIINIGVVTASMPVTGMPLPFFSYGGTSLVILLCEVGILLNISRSTAK